MRFVEQFTEAVTRLVAIALIFTYGAYGSHAQESPSLRSLLTNSQPSDDRPSISEPSISPQNAKPDERRKDSRESRDRPRNFDRPYDHDSYDTDSLGLGHVLFEAAGYVVASPILLPLLACQDDYRGGRMGYFQRYPFEDRESHMIFSDQETLDYLNGHSQQYSRRFSVDYLSNFLKQDCVSVHGLFEGTSRLGIDSSYYDRDDVPSLARDEFGFADLNILFRFAQGPNAQFRIGPGMNFANIDRQFQLGWNLTYQADIYIFKPLISSTEFDIGQIGADPVFHGRTTIGYSINRFEPYLGFEYWDIGRSDSRLFVAGLRIWL